MSWIQTYTGKKFDLLEPTVDMIDFKDIAHALALQCRFTGHTKRFYSVAEHCTNVTRLASAGQELAGLLHDAAEAYTGDLNTPLKRLCPDYIKVQDRIEEVIAKKFGIDYPYHPSIHEADKACLIAEAKSLFDSQVDNWTDEYEKRVDIELPRLWVIGMPWDSAERYYQLTFDKIKDGSYGKSSKSANSLSILHRALKVRPTQRKRASA